MLTYNISQLLSKPQGSHETHDIDEKISFDPKENFVVKSRFTAKAKFLRLAHEINVQFADFAIDIECKCVRCLKKYSEHIAIPFAEREFIIDVPRNMRDPGEDAFFIDKKYNVISLLEMARQEIILHFPITPVCSKDCKGLCEKCGQNLNENSCPHV